MQRCKQPQLTNPLRLWPHINTFKLTRLDGNQSVYSTCHPSFGKTCLFALSSEQRLNKQSLAYASYYCLPEFVSPNHPQIRLQRWAGCSGVWGWLLMMWCNRVAQVTKHTSPSAWLPPMLWGHSLSTQTSQPFNPWKKKRKKRDQIISQVVVHHR